MLLRQYMYFMMHIVTLMSLCICVVELIHHHHHRHCTFLKGHQRYLYPLITLSSYLINQHMSIALNYGTKFSAYYNHHQIKLIAQIMHLSQTQ